MADIIALGSKGASMANTQKHDNDQLAIVAGELKNGTWLANAQRRSQRRKSAWNILLPLLGFPLWGAITFSLTKGASHLHGLVHPDAPNLFHNGPLTLSQALTLFPSFIAAIFPAFLLANFFVYLIPAARRAMDLEDRGYPGTSYRTSQCALFKCGLWALAICLPLILAGALLV